jgi:condensin complex subunit 3
VIRFIIAFTAHREPGHEEEADEFCESLIRFLLNVTAAKDRAIRFRACQMVAGILNALGPDAEISDDLYDQMEETMLERLRDNTPAVRAQAARALSRLQDGGEDADFSNSEITTAFIELIGGEKNKDARKAILGALAISDHTISVVVERTRDISEEVRRIAFLALAAKVPVESVSIEHRALVLRRGLNDRSISVRSACVDMLKKWMSSNVCENDPIQLLKLLDAESHPNVSEMALKTLIETKTVKAMAYATKEKSEASGLRRFFLKKSEEEEEEKVVELFSPEEALFWRVIVEALANQTSSSGKDTSLAVGQARAVLQAETEEVEDALDQCLPESSMDLLRAISMHADGKTTSSVFAARQLMMTLNCSDMNDGALRRGAATLVYERLRSIGDLNDENDVSCYARGGDGEWEKQLIDLAKRVHDDNEHVAVVLGACDSLRGTVTDEESNKNDDDVNDDDDTNVYAETQALFIASSLFETANNSSSSKLPAHATEAVMQSLVRPAVAHASVGVRREGIKLLGLLLMCGTNALTEETVQILRTAADADPSEPVKCMALRALGDAAMLYGPKALDARRHMPVPKKGIHVRFDDDDDDDEREEDEKEKENNDDDDADADADGEENETAGYQLTLEKQLLRIIESACEPFENPKDKTDLEELDAENIDAMNEAAFTESENSAQTIACETLAKLALRRGYYAFEQPSLVISTLLGAIFACNAQETPRLAQCLAVFFPAIASAPDAKVRACLIDAVLPSLRMASQKKGIAKVAAFLTSLLELETGISSSSNKDPGGDEASNSDNNKNTTGVIERSDAGEAELVRSLSIEILALNAKPFGTGVAGAQVKAYHAAVSRVLSRVPIPDVKSMLTSQPSNDGSAVNGSIVSEETKQRVTLQLSEAFVAMKMATKKCPKEKIALKDINIAKDRIHDSLGVSSSSSSNSNNNNNDNEEGEDEVETLFNEDLQFAEYTEGVEKYASELSQSEDLPFYDRKGPKVSKLKEKVMAVPARERSKRAAAQVASEKWVEDDLNVPLAKVTPQPTRSSRRREALQEFNE